MLQESINLVANTKNINIALYRYMFACDLLINTDFIDSDDKRNIKSQFDEALKDTVLRLINVKI